MKPRRSFTAAIVVPALLLYVVSAAVVVFCLSMMAQHMNRLEDQRGLTVMNAALSGFINQLSAAVADEGTWNEAHLNVVVDPDLAWMDSTWGATARLGTTYDDVMVTDAGGNIVFGENNLGPISGPIKSRYPAAAAMLTELDRAIAQSGDTAVIAHFAQQGQSPVGLAAISIHRAIAGESAVPRNSRRVLWIAKYVDAGVLQDIAGRYQLPLAALVAETPAGTTSINIVDAEGQPAGIIAWTADRPGDSALRGALMNVAVVFAVIGVLLAFGLSLLRRAMRRRAAIDDAALADRPAAPIAAAAPASVAAPAPTLATTSSSVVTEAPDSPIAGVAAADFTVEYQPILDLRAETMVGVKALLRWKKPDGTPLLQEDLAAADCAALMERAGIMALRHAAGELGPLLGVMLTMSVTPSQLLNGVFAEKLAGTLGATNFPARRLQLNVDTSLLPPAEALAAPIAEFHRMGVAVAFAGFTLGAGTIGYIRPGLANRFCLDPAMIAGIDTDPLRLKLVEATIDAARTIDASITVPGLERPAQAARLLRLGCREFRGPLLAKPLAIAPL
ncbi:MAG: EAL domain-containing protein, partial [Hyphomicrobiales bacterium]